MEKFTFYTRFNLPELTGLKARDLEELLTLTRVVPDSCIYHHTHDFLQRHEYLSPAQGNHFAYWISSALGDEELAEKVSSIDFVQFGSIAEIRNSIVSVIERHVAGFPSCKQRFAKTGREFYFIKAISIVMPTAYIAEDLTQFRDALEKVSDDSIYFHIFESKLRLGKGKNDFSLWIDNALHDSELAAKIARLDPYSYDIKDLKNTMLKIISDKVVQYAYNS